MHKTTDPTKFYNNFGTDSKSTRPQKSQITKFRLSQLQHKFDEQLEINQNLVYELNHTFTLLSTVTHHSDLRIIIQNIKSKVFRKERKND